VKEVAQQADEIEEIQEKAEEHDEKMFNAFTFSKG